MQLQFQSLDWNNLKIFSQPYGQVSLLPLNKENPTELMFWNSKELEFQNA